jgi:hypothetical protein
MSAFLISRTLSSLGRIPIPMSMSFVVSKSLVSVDPMRLYLTLTTVPDTLPDQVSVSFPAKIPQTVSSQSLPPYTIPAHIPKHTYTLPPHTLPMLPQTLPMLPQTLPALPQSLTPTLACAHHFSKTHKPHSGHGESRCFTLPL